MKYFFVTMCKLYCGLAKPFESTLSTGLLLAKLTDCVATGQNWKHGKALQILNGTFMVEKTSMEAS